MSDDCNVSRRSSIRLCPLYTYEIDIDNDVQRGKNILFSVFSLLSLVDSEENGNEFIISCLEQTQD